jgi:hypothetical protein
MVVADEMTTYLSTTPRALCACDSVSCDEDVTTATELEMGVVDH